VRCKSHRIRKRVEIPEGGVARLSVSIILLPIALAPSGINLMAEQTAR